MPVMGDERPGRRPAEAGGDPVFPEGLPLIRPAVGERSAAVERISEVLASGVLTNGPLVKELEDRTAAYLGVRHVVAVSSCTAGLMLVIRAAELSGDAVLPSFTFVATAHALAWNGLRPAFVEVDPETLTLDPDAVGHGMGVRTSAVVATHTYGTPCDVEALEKVARENGVWLFFDAAHAFGSRRRGVPVGRFGHAEVFSLSPTKVMVGGEGGLIATDDDVLAKRCRLGRDYGNQPNYDCSFIGLNARMSEVHAAIALASFEGLDERIRARNALAAAYRTLLGDLPGISFPLVAEGDLSTYKDFTALVDPPVFGLEASALASALAAEGVETRRYFSPPVHLTRAYRGRGKVNGRLPVTEAAAARVLTLPLWTGMTQGHLERVAAAVSSIRSWYAAEGETLTS